MLCILGRPSRTCDGITRREVLCAGGLSMMCALTLPQWLQGWVAVNPVTHVIEAMRGLLSGPSALVAGETVGGEVLWVLASCVVLVAIFFPLATLAYRRKV